MKKGTFVYALSEIDEVLLCKYMPASFDKVDYSYVEAENKGGIKLIWRFVACLGVVITLSILLSILGMQNDQMKPGMDTDHSEVLLSDSETEEKYYETDMYYPAPLMYPNYSDGTSLLKIKPVGYYGTYYGLITRTPTGKAESQKNVIIEAEVEKDYYGNLKAGEKVYIAFPIVFEWGNIHHTIVVEEFVDAINGCKSLILYTDTLNSTHFYFEDEGCEGVRIDLDNLCSCVFYSDGIIPITKDSAVDFSIINDMFEKDSINIEDYYKNIRASGISILQGDSEGEMGEKIKELIDKKIYGG